MNLPPTGRRVLVSGASRGLGRAVARAFAANGDRVAVHFGSRADEALATLDSLDGGGHALTGGDLADPAGAAAVVDAAAEALGGIDVLVNNAAVNIRHPLPETPYEEWVAVWQRHVAVNLLATANLSHLVARRMIDRDEGGRIVNIGSRGAFRGNRTTRPTARRRPRSTRWGSPSRCRWRRTASVSPRWHPDSSPPNGSPTVSRGPKVPESWHRAPSAGSARRRRSPPRSSGSPPPRPSGPRARSWT